MAGVIVEIDAVLTQQSLARLGADLEKATAQLGTGLAKGATAPAQAFATQLVTTLKTRLATESAVLGKQLSEGTLSPAQYSAAATRLGKEIIKDLNAGIRSGQKLELFSGEGGLALRNQLQGVTAAATQTGRAVTAAVGPIAAVGTVSMRTSPALNAIRGSMVSLASTAAGVPGPLGRIVSTLLLFGGGGGVALVAAVAIGIAALAIERLTKSAREGRKAAEDLVKSLKDLGKSEGQLLQEQINNQRAVIEATKDRIDDIEETRAQLRKQGGGAFLTEEDLQKELKLLRGLEAGLAALRQKQIDLKHPFTVETSEPPNVTEEAEKAERVQEKNARAAAKRLEELKRHQEELLKNQLELTAAFNAFWDDIEAKANLAGPMVVARIREMQAAAKETFTEKIQWNFDKVQDNLTVIEKGLDKIGEGNKVFSKFKQEVEDTRTPAERLRDSIHSITGALDNLIQRNGIALLGEDATRSIGSVLNLVDAIGDLRDSLGNITAAGAIGLGSAALGVIGSLTAESAASKALREALENNVLALRDLSENLDELNVSMTGARFGATKGGLASVMRGEQGRGEDVGLSFTNRIYDMAKWDAALRRAGTSMKDVGKLAEELGISLEGNALTQFIQLQEAIDAVDLTKFTDTFEGQMELDERRRRLEGGESNAQDRLAALTKQLQDPETGSSALAGVLGGDTSTKAGLEAMKKRLQELLADFPNLAAEQLGGLTRDQFLDALNQAGDLVNEGLADLAQAAIDAAAKARDGLLTEEEAQVQAAHEVERAQAIMEAVAAGTAAGGEAASLAAQIAAAEDKRRQLESGPLGVDSPLAQEQRRIIDELLGQLGRIAPSGAGDKVTPGFQVSREITEASSSRLIGELTTISMHTSWLPKLYDLIAGGRPVAAGPAGAGDAPYVIQNHLYLDGRELALELTGPVSARQYENYQNAAALNGNSSMS